MRRILSPFRWLLLTWWAVSAFAFGQEDAATLLEDVSASVAAIQDVSLLLTGRLVDQGGSEVALEIEFLAMPQEQALSAYVLQPDAFADNMIVLDGDVIANYTFLTHQVTLFDANDPDAFGGFLQGSAANPAELTLDATVWFDGWNAEIVGPRDTPVGAATVVRLENPEAMDVAWVELAVRVEDRLPYEVILYDVDDRALAEIRFENVQVDTGLSRDEVTYLPEDAEIIDERSEARAP